MIRCTSCGYENNDGSQRCLQCRTLLPVRRENSDYAIAMHTYQAGKKQQQEQQRDLKKIVAVVLVVVLLFGAFSLYRAATLSDRAETAAKNYINNNYSNVSYIVCTDIMGIPSGYTTAAFEYLVSMTLYFDNGGTSQAVVSVEMDSIFADGKVTRMH